MDDIIKVLTITWLTIQIAHKLADWFTDDK